jgi:hypothetical protein
MYGRHIGFRNCRPRRLVERRTSSRKVMMRFRDNRYARLHPFNQTLISHTLGSMFLNPYAPRVNGHVAETSL